MKSTSTSRLLALAVALVACEGSHSDLGVEQTTSSASTTGATTGSGQGGEGTGGGDTIVEPDGPPKLTIVHGVVDQPAIQLCFLASPPEAADPAAPFPAEPLAWAHAVSVDLPGDPIPADGDVEILVLAGDLGSIAGLGCRALADDPGAVPDAIVQSLGVAPRSAIDMPRSLLLVPTGCLAPGHDDPLATQVCGETYTADTPTPNVVLAPMSRVLDFDAIGFQAVHAISGTSLEVDVGVVPMGGSERTVGDDVTFGEISPFPPNRSLTGTQLEGPSAALLRTYIDPGGTVNAEILLGEAMTNGSLEADAFKSGTNVVLVAVGPTPGTAKGSFWNEFTFVALRSDP